MRCLANHTIVMLVLPWCVQCCGVVTMCITINLWWWGHHCRHSGHTVAALWAYGHTMRLCGTPEITGRSMCTIHSPQHAWQTGTMQPRCNQAHSSIQPPSSLPSSFLLNMMDVMMLLGTLTSPAVREGGSDNWHRPLLMSQVLSPTQY